MFNNNNNKENTMPKFNNKEKKLLLECVEHFMSWEQNMERAFVTKIIKSKGLLGIDIVTSETKPTPKFSELQKLEKKLGGINA
tara:strand:+ start:1000 stop:1248 length:249 start_codon:yes stop_codon:yes gene_type:complete